jgi:hypothetical protein
MVNVKTGESLNQTSLQDYNPQTVDAGWNESQYRAMLELQQEIDEIQASAGGGSGLNTEIFGVPAYVLLLLAAAGAMFLSGRD